MKVRTLKISISAAVVLVLVFSALPLTAQQEEGTTLEQKFRQANQLYSQGKFVEAAGLYGEIIRYNGGSMALYYNLGCAEFKADSLGKAVLNFHRAARLAPRDPDIRANLRFVQALTAPKTDENREEDGFIVGFLGRLIFMLSDREVALLQLAFLAWITLGAAWLILGCPEFWRRILIGFTLAGALLLASNSLILGIHLYRSNYHPQAVVVAASAEALSGPGQENTKVLALPEGTLVRIEERRSRWVLISLPSGRSGWVQEESITEI